MCRLNISRCRTFMLTAVVSLSVAVASIGGSSASAATSNPTPNFLFPANYGYMDPFGNTKLFGFPQIQSSDFSGTIPGSVTSFLNSSEMLPKDSGVTMDGSSADAARLQTYINTYKPAYLNLSPGLWPVNSTYNSANEPYGRFTPDHSVAGAMFINALGVFQSDNNAIALADPGVTSPAAGQNAADPAVDLYQSWQNGGLLYTQRHDGGVFYGPEFSIRHTMNTDDHPSYYNSGEYGNTIITDIEGVDNGRSGQLLALNIGVSNAKTKGFPAQEQLINFNGNYYGKAGHWDLVGGFTDHTHEPSGGGWEHQLWEADAGGTGPILNDCNENAWNSHCGRQGVVIVPSKTVFDLSSFTYGAQSFVADYDNNGTINSNVPSERYYNQDQSTHILVQNMRSYTDQKGNTISAGGIYRTIPYTQYYKGMTGSETSTMLYTDYALDHISVLSPGTGYKVGDVITASSMSSWPAVTVTAVDSSGAVTGVSYKVSGTVSGNQSYTNAVTSGGSGSGMTLTAVYQGVLYKVYSYTMTSGGSGYKSGDVLTDTLGDVTTVTSVDSNGVILTSTSVLTGKPFKSNPKGSQSISGGSGSGATFTVASVFNNYINYEAVAPESFWWQQGYGFEVGDTIPLNYTDTYGGIHHLADAVLTSVWNPTDGVGGFPLTGGVTLNNVEGQVLSLSSTSYIQVQPIDTKSTSGATITNASYSELSITITDVLDEWAKSNGPQGSGYKVGDTLSLYASDGTALANYTVMTIHSGGALDGNDLDQTWANTTSTDYTGMVTTVTGGSGSGAKFYIEEAPSNGGFVPTPVAKYFGGLHSGVPFSLEYNADGSSCSTCAVMEWVSEDEFEWGTGFGLNYNPGTYFGTGFYSDARFMNAAIDLSGSAYLMDSSAQIRLQPGTTAIDFDPTGTEAGKNQATMIYQNLSFGSQQPGLQVTDHRGSTQFTTVLNTHFGEALFPGIVSIGYQDAGELSALYSGNYPTPPVGWTFVTGKTSTKTTDILSPVGGFSFWELPSGATANSDGTYGANSFNKIVQFEESVSLLNTKVFTLTGAFVHTGITYATLPDSPAVGTEVYCTDCYTRLRSDSDTSTGIPVWWNGSTWTDSMGISAMH